MSEIVQECPRCSLFRVLGAMHINGCPNILLDPDGRSAEEAEEASRKPLPTDLIWAKHVPYALVEEPKRSAKQGENESKPPTVASGVGATKSRKQRKRDAYGALERRVFRATNGRPPWSCFWCEGDVTLSNLTIHHFDGDHSNNDPRNLRAAHPNCHWATHDAETRGYQKALHGEPDVVVESL